MENIDTKVFTRCREIGTSTWSDAMDACGIDGVIRGIAQRSGKGRFAGFAVTARETAGMLGKYPRSAFGVGEIIDAAKQNQVLLIDVGGADISTFGGLASLATARKGVAAVIIDGACRDIDEIRSSGLWLASRTVTPTTGKTRLKLEAINEPIIVGNIGVRAGDVVIGDDTGIVVVPQDRFHEVLSAADKMLATDRMMETAIEKGASFKEAAAAANYIR